MQGQFSHDASARSFADIATRCFSKIGACEDRRRHCRMDDQGQIFWREVPGRPTNATVSLRALPGWPCRFTSAHSLLAHTAHWKCRTGRHSERFLAFSNPPGRKKASAQSRDPSVLHPIIVINNRSKELNLSVSQRMPPAFPIHCTSNLVLHYHSILLTSGKP